MGKNIKVSIVVPIYKVPECFLRQCIESCIEQTIEDIEIILVDDGCPNNCGRICEEYAAKDARIKVIHKKNEGLAAARNTGQDAVIGETMMFLDGDDYLDLEACEKAYFLLKKENVQIVLFDQQLVYGKKIRPTPVCFKMPERFDNNQECRKLQARVLDFNGWMATATSKLIKTDYVRKHNIRHLVKLSQGVEGYIFNIRLFETAEKAYYLHKPLYNYIYNSESITHTPNLINNTLIIAGLEYIDAYGKQHKVLPQFRKNLLNRVLVCIITCAIQGCFNPINTMSFDEQEAWYENFIKNDLIQDALKNADKKGLNMQRRIVLALIKFRQYRLISMLSWLRRKQLESR